MFVGLYQCLLSMLSPNLVFLPNSLFIEKQRMVYCMSGWVSTVKCPCQNVLKQTFLQLKHDMGSSKIVSCGLFNQWRQWLSTFWLNGWFDSSLIAGNVGSLYDPLMSWHTYVMTHLCHDTPMSHEIKDKTHQIICCEKAKLSFMANFISECQFKDR